MPTFHHSLFSVFLIWGLFSVAACGKQLSPAEHLSRAKDFIEEENYTAATIELKNVLLGNQENMEARWLLAIVAIELGNGAMAEKEINWAIKTGLEPQAGQPILVKSISLQSKWDQVLAETVQLPEGMSNESQALILSLRGQAYLVKGNFDEAKKNLERALEVYPGSSEALVGMAALYGFQRNYGEARPWLQRALDEDSSYADAWAALGDVEMLEGNFEEAEAAFTNAIKFRRYMNLDHAKRALVRAELGMFRDAEADIQSLKPVFKTNPHVNYAEGLTYFKQEKYAEAEQALQASYSSMPNSARTGILLATTHLMLGNLEQAKSVAERLSAQTPHSRTSQQLLGTILVNRMEYDAALDVLRKSLNDAPDDPMTLQMLANVSLFNGNTSQAVAYAQKLVSVAPESDSARDMLSLAKLMDDQKLGNEAAGDNEFAGEFLYAIEAFKKNNFGEALERSQKLHEKYPEKVDPLNLMAACYLALAKWDKAKIEMQKVLDLKPNEPTATKNLAKVEAQAGNLERAQTLLQGFLKVSPGDEEAILLLAGIQTRQGNSADSIRVLERGVEKNPNSLPVRAKLVEEYFRASQFAKILEVTRDLTDEQFQEQPVLLEFQAKAQMRVGDDVAANLSLKHLVAVVPDSAHAHYLYGDSLARSGKIDRAREQMDRAVQIDPYYFPARVGQIKILSQQGEMKSAEEALAEAKQDFGARPEMVSIEGFFALVRGDYATAAERFSSGLEEKPDTELTILLVKALWGQQKYDEAIEIMQGWLKDHPQDINVLIHLAGGYLALNRDGEARAVYAKVVELYPNHVPALNNLAWLSRDGDLGKAIAYARKADQLSPNDSQVLDTLGMLLLKSGDVSHGFGLIRRAADLSPENPEIQLHLGRALVQKKNYSEARKVLSSLISQTSESKISNEAKVLLESIPKN